MDHLPIKATILEHETGRTIRPTELNEEIKSRATRLSQSYKLERGSAVLLADYNTIDFFINFFASLRLGLNVVPLDPNLGELEKRNVITHCKASLILQGPGESHIAHNQPTLPHESSLILYTSGTTGSPKGVVISNEALALKLDVLASKIPVADIQSSLCGLPTYFGHGLISNALFPLFYADQLLLLKKFDVQSCGELPRILNSNAISFFSTVPSVWEMILNFSEKTEMPTLKRIHSASSPLDGDKIDRILKWAGRAKLYDTYGITEMLSWFAVREVKPDNPRVREFDEFWKTDTRLSPEGELLVRSEFMFSGYLLNDEANRVALTDDGYFHTGDIFQGPKMMGRVKNVITKNGAKIYCEDIDQLLLSSGLVKDVCSFPIPNEFSGERLGVLMVLVSGVDEKSVDEFCRKSLGSFKVPDQYWVREQITRSGRGKINRLNLYKELSSGSR